MKKKKSEIFKLENIPAAVKRWKTTIRKGPSIMNNEFLEKFGGLVFAFMHLLDGKQQVAMCFYNEEYIAETVPVKEMADILLNKHACIFSTESDSASIHYDIYFVFNEDQTEVDCLICVDNSIGAIHILNDVRHLPEVLKKFMDIDDTQMNLIYLTIAKLIFKN